MRQHLAVFTIVALVASSSLAQDPSTTRDKTRRGAVVGAVAGSVLGAVVGNNRGNGNARKGAVIGAVAGTAIGAGIGAYMDKQERELRQIEGVEVRRTDDDELRVTVRNDVLFDYNSSALRSASRSALREMADVFARYDATTISVDGFADSTGSENFNLSLSRRRARSVSSYLDTLGLDGSRLSVRAFGESRPRASNSTESGRQQNRRVEIHVKADRA